jgi:DNA-binding CsgD family transcriptional regulator
MAAVWLSMLYNATLGNQSACSGWAARARRLADEDDGSGIHGWVALADAVEATDPRRARGLAERALGHAREDGDADLELCALGELASALVAVGREQEGLALVDEAVAATLAGEYASRDAVVAAICSTLRACERAGDLERVRDLCRVADGFMRAYACPFLFADCRMRYGRVLLMNGRWDEAARELIAAARVGPPDSDYHVHAVASLAELRVRQGRIEDAEALLLRLPDRPPLRPVAAAVRHARGEHAVAAAILERCLDGLEPGEPDAAPALALLVEVHLARGDLGAADRTARTLATVAARTGRDRLAAHVALASGLTAAAAGDRERSARLLARAGDLFGGAGQPYEAARARLALARAHMDRDPEVAVADAQEALAAFQRLGAAPDAGSAAALLRTLGAPPGSGPRSPGTLTQREREILQLLGSGLSNPEIAERLVISRKTASYHVSNVLRKLGLRNRAEAASYTARAGPEP